MMDLSIFDSKGVFQDLPENVLSTLSDVQSAAYQKTRQCAADLKVADKIAADALADVKACNAAVIEMENYIRKTYPEKKFHDLWKETFTRQMKT